MATEQANPLDSPQVYDVIEIGGIVSPGICRVRGFKREQTWDVKKGKGVRGSTSTLVQFPPAKGTITFFLWTAAHFTAWALFRPLFLYDPTKKAVQALDIWYPTLLDINISSVVTDDISAIEPVSDPPDGLFQVIVSLHEYFPPAKKSAVSTPSGSQSNGTAPGAPGSPPGTPVQSAPDSQQAEIAALLKKAQAA